MKDHIMSREGRKWAYGIIVAGLLVLGGYEIVTDGQVALWTTLGAAVLGIGGSGLAAANLPPKDGGEHRVE